MINIFRKCCDQMGNFSRELESIKANQVKILSLRYSN